MERKRLSRFSYDPLLGKDGKSVTVTERDLTRWDVERIKALLPYDYLTADYIAALTGGSEVSVTDRYNVMKRHPSRWVDIARPQLETPRYYLHSYLAYSNSERAVKYLADRDITAPYYGFSGSFEHKIMSQWIRAGFDIAVHVEKAPAGLLTFDQIITSPNTPSVTRTEKGNHKHQLPVTIDNRLRWITPDAYPFAVSNPTGYALLFIEADCNTMSISAQDGNDIELKLRQYLEVFKSRTYYTRYGFKKAYMAFYTDNHTHLKKVIECAAFVTENDKQYRKNFLFKYHHSYDSKERLPATGHVLTEPYMRIAMPDFSLLTGEEVTHGHRQTEVAYRAA